MFLTFLFPVSSPPPASFPTFVNLPHLHGPSKCLVYSLPLFHQISYHLSHTFFLKKVLPLLLRCVLLSFGATCRCLLEKINLEKLFPPPLRFKSQQFCIASHNHSYVTAQSKSKKEKKNEHIFPNAPRNPHNKFITKCVLICPSSPGHCLSLSL
ncbi:hypothetical protein, unlikely [Trypanosoma brucei gambiense DAL972]|uniref:Uncharacterized protein n=1 Tax=Trypanosoma brucei gambiense (strain MHOM/CI/86/DAL972) TaxID=679716 RepID=C9ZJF2_TRYB9|nr:hypothetical protein, unlikely [Trypanosoma brucei gambiense DAL972]CBH09511.1 hypothetical protein, unlikely [Trypanosoma brucei gambiense DAL972]|eukprot:XP_011771816.1 hypothetical protein, unlikely [Trypanosoma brucei gambiense DAL972]